MLNLCKINSFNITAHYVKDIEVAYRDDKGAPSGFIDDNINKGFNGTFVYIRPTWTDDKFQAATSFEFKKTGDEDNSYKNIAKGAGGEYRYLIPQTNAGGQPINTIWLTENKSDAVCADELNAGRGGRDLYLCWEAAGIRCEIYLNPFSDGALYAKQYFTNILKHYFTF